jgi:predicted negative regulator of RcsB-dependent stress response
MQSEVVQLPLADRLWAWFETNRNRVIYGAVAVVALGLIIWFVLWRHEEKEASAGQAFATVASSVSASGLRPDTANAYLKVANEYPDSAAGARAQLLAASTLFLTGKYPEAQAQFEKFSRQHHDSPLMGNAVLGVAACLEAQGKTNEATTAYKDLVDRHPNEPFINQAKFSLGRLFEIQNKPEQAILYYQQIEHIDPFLGPEAGMRVEELKVKYPNLAPTAPVPTNAPFRIEKGK